MVGTHSASLVTMKTSFGFQLMRAALPSGRPARIGRAAAALFARRREPMADLISDSQEHDGVLRNLSSLSPEDQEAFVELLKSGAPRFVVHRLSTAYPLLSKGILRSVQILDDLDWICEFHPAITNRAKL